MAVKLGSARGSYGNTKAGDQAGGREISTQDWYAHSKGWVVIRAIDPDVREKIATAMERACDNNDIGYSQTTRLTLRENVKDKGFDPAKTTKPVNTDCSALVRVCCNFAGIEVANFNTATETAMLMATGMFIKFTDADHCKSSKRLLRGDILNTKTKGHTAVVLSDGSLAKSEKEYGTIKQADAQTSAHARSSEKPSANGHFLGSRLLKNGMEGEDVKELQRALIQLGYSCGAWGIDGEYGDATEMAVTSFQRRYGLEPDGQYGKLTHARLMTELERLHVSDVPTCVRIEGGNCYVRDCASTQGEKLGIAYKGQILPFAGEVSVDGWLKISFAGLDAWISGKYGRLVG